MTPIRSTCSCTSAPLLRAGALVCATCGAPLVMDAGGATRLHSQRDGERPAGCGRTKYLRTWKRARDAGDPGATSDGRARLLTPDAYARHAATSATPSRSRKGSNRVEAATVDIGDDVLAQLGLGSGRRTA